MSITTVWRPSAGERIVLSPNVSRAAVRVFLGGIRNWSQSNIDLTVGRAGQRCLTLPKTRLAEIVDRIAAERGVCRVVLDYKEGSVCTVECQNAEVVPVEECVCPCGGAFHMQSAGRQVTERIILVEGVRRRELWVRRGQSLHQVLRGDFSVAA